MRPTLRVLSSVLAAAGVIGVPALAVGAEEGHVHVRLEIDPALDWNTLIDATLTAHPRGVELVARADEAAAWVARGKRWLAAAPALYFSYLSDRPLDNLGQREYDLGVELPLWRAGQRSAVQAEAGAATVASAAAAAALRLEVAGLLRGALWDVEAADSELSAGRDAVVVAEELVRIVEVRNARGDVSRADVLLAQATLLDKQQSVVALEAALLDAERSYRSLTGLDAKPAEFSEQRTAHVEIGSDHPLVALADAEILRARAHADVVEREVRGGVIVTIGPHRQYDALTVLRNDSLTLGVRVPVGGKQHGETQHAQALRAAAAAMSDRGQLQRRLDLDLHEAEHSLVVLEETIVLADQSLALGEQQERMARIAFDQGEIELRELLRIEEALQIARRNRQRLDVEQRRTVAALNQAVGETP